MNPLQIELPLLCRIDGPSVVPPQVVQTAHTYREACRLCRQLSPRKRMTMRQVCEEAGLIPQHAGDYFNADDGKSRRDLPAACVPAVERVMGNTAISQWLAAQAKLTVLEEMQAKAFADRRAA